MSQRRRLIRTTSLKDRLASFAQEAQNKAKFLQAGTERDELLRKARRAHIGAHIDDWAHSPGLQPPK
jgi:hypothetical protein